MKASADEIRDRFESCVDYLSDLERGQAAIIDAPLALDLVARAASATTPHAQHVLDVGCGGGNYALKLLQHLPGLNVTLLDLGELLLKRAMERVSAATSGQVVALQGDIRAVNLGDERFDIILAGAVLHHLRAKAEWQAVFAKLHAALRPRGSLWISDLVEHAAPAIQAIMTARYGAYLVQLGGEEFRDRVFAEIAAQDTPRPLVFQIDLLRKVGFSAVEVLHKNGCFATFGAVKAASPLTPGAS
jgi:tRNA (cmo5U34)-methyltransferase